MRTLQSKQFGGILLISGTAIGVGMLAGPIASGPSGIVAALCSLFAIFSFTLAALFVFLEALYFFDDTSIYRFENHEIQGMKDFYIFLLAHSHLVPLKIFFSYVEL